MSGMAALVIDTLSQDMPTAAARCVVSLSVSRSGVDLDELSPTTANRFSAQLASNLRAVVRDVHTREACLRRVETLLSGPTGSGQSRLIPINDESDIVKAREAGREMAASIGFPPSALVKIATAISELARNIVLYAERGEVSIEVARIPPHISITARDEGPGIPNLKQVLAGQHRSRHGLGMGLGGTRNLVDHFEVDTSPQRGTTVRLRKDLE